MHRKLNTSNTNNCLKSSKLLTLEGLGAGGHTGCLLMVRNADTFRKTSCVFKSSERYYLMGRCDSLLLMYDESWCNVRLINASIRKSLILAHCPLLSGSESGSESEYEYEYEYESEPDFIFGFARLSQDYKVIAISFESIEEEDVCQSRVAVYTLRDQQWTIRDNELNIDWSSFDHRSGPYYVCEGAVHWLWDKVGSGNNRRPNYIVSLDFDTENFTFLELPRELDEMDSSRFLFVLGESLAILCVSYEITRIWILENKSEKEDWTLRFSNPSSHEGFILFNNRMHTRRVRVLYYEGDGGYLLYGKLSYNIATGKVELLVKSMMSRHVEFEKYSESLVLCNGYDTEDMTSSPFVLHK